jgi:hypothetical protein
MVACPTCNEVFFTAAEAEFTHCASPHCNNSWICACCQIRCDGLCAEFFCLDCVATIEDPYEMDENLDPRCCAECAKTIEFTPRRIPAQTETRNAAVAKGQVA